MGDIRNDFAAFCADVLSQPMWEHQVEAATATAFITAIAAARRTGKTELAENLAIWTAFRERDVTVLLLSATDDASRRSIESINIKLSRNDLARGAVVDDYATRISLTNGSRIVSLPASERQARGYGKGVKLVVLDEAAMMTGALWTAAHYVALDERANGARILLASTPRGPGDHFFRKAWESGKDGDPEFSSHQWTYKVNPKLDHAYLERQRDRISPMEYAAEALGEWSESEGALIPWSLLNRQTVGVQLPAIADLAPPARGIIGCDWGFSFDRSAQAAIFRLPLGSLNPEAEARPRFIVVPRIFPAGAPLTDVVDAVVRKKESFRYFSSELNGLGAMPTTELRRRLGSGSLTWNPVTTTNAIKTAAYGTILGLLERGQLFLPREPDLLRQLAGLRFEHGERGFTRIEAEDAAVHDDVADALALAALPYRRKRGKGVACALLAMAGERALPDADVPPSGGDFLQTASGLSVWRRPPLMSVAGPELSFPNRWSKHSEPARQLGRFTITTGGST